MRCARQALGSAAEKGWAGTLSFIPARYFCKQCKTREPHAYRVPRRHASTVRQGLLPRGSYSCQAISAARSALPTKMSSGRLLRQCPFHPVEHLLLAGCIADAYFQIHVAHSARGSQAGKRSIVLLRTVLLQNHVVRRRGEQPEIVWIGT